MKLNREKVAAGLSLLLLVFGVYSAVGRRLAEEAPEISTAIPPYTQEVPRHEPRLFLEESSGSRNPFQVASDWVAITPEPLPAPPLPPSGWVLLPLGTSADPADAGLAFAREPPVEQKTDAEADKESEGTEKPSTGGESAATDSTRTDSPKSDSPKSDSTKSDSTAKKPDDGASTAGGSGGGERS